MANYCKTKMVVQTSELVCQSCGNVAELAITSFAHIRKILEKYRILDAVNTHVSDGRELCGLLRCRFMGNVIHYSLMTASRSTMSVFCMITSKLFLQKPGCRRKKSSNFFPPFSKGFSQQPNAVRNKDSISGGQQRET